MGREAERHAAETVADVADPRSGWPEGTEPYEELQAEQAFDEMMGTFFDAVEQGRELIEEQQRREEAERNSCHEGEDPFSEGPTLTIPPELQLHEPNASYPGDELDPDVDGTDEGFPVS
jgi:hypothetical protein